MESGLNATLVQKLPGCHLPKNLEDLSDPKLVKICSQHRLEDVNSRTEQIAAIENIRHTQSMRENRLSKRNFMGTILWKKTVSSVNPEAGQGVVAPLGRSYGNVKPNPDEWRPMRSRKNAHSMTYTTLPSFQQTTSLKSSST